jgi:hypothetical protein
MTIWGDKQKKCALCGEIADYKVIVSSYSFIGIQYFDSRRIEMTLLDLECYIQRCPHCGYCSPDIEKFSPRAQATMDNPRYKNQLSDPLFCEIANSFLCFAMIEEENEDYVSAGWNCVRAAWACDDYENVEGGIKSRERACVFFEKAEEIGFRITKEFGAPYILLTDLYRRSGQFEKAIETCQRGMPLVVEDYLKNMLKEEVKLINKHDTGRY